MSGKLHSIFEDVEAQARLLCRYWEDFSTEVIHHLPEKYHPEIQDLSDSLAQALEELVQGLQNPVLTLATAGTTSSGKSTLVNLLCGAEIVPVAVSEMSAGAVTIEYSHERSLVITETPGALWECGEWRGISEDEICRRLNQAMRSYIDNHLEPEYRGLACPNAVIGYDNFLIFGQDFFVS